MLTLNAGTTAKLGVALALVATGLACLIVSDLQSLAPWARIAISAPYFVVLGFLFGRKTVPGGSRFERQWLVIAALSLWNAAWWPSNLIARIYDTPAGDQRYLLLVRPRFLFPFLTLVGAGLLGFFLARAIARRRARRTTDSAN